jgi:hypothetical protein
VCLPFSLTHNISLKHGQPFINIVFNCYYICFSLFPFSHHPPQAWTTKIKMHQSTTFFVSTKTRSCDRWCSYWMRRSGSSPPTKVCRFAYISTSPHPRNFDDGSHYNFQRFVVACRAQSKVDRQEGDSQILSETGRMPRGGWWRNIPSQHNLLISASFSDEEPRI